MKINVCEFENFTWAIPTDRLIFFLIRFKTYLESLAGESKA